MDQAFLMRARRLLEQHRPACLDHRRLVATVRDQQSQSVTARAQAALGDALPAPDGATLASLLLAGSDWREAAARLSGCFSRPAPERPLNIR